jgi:hypothetical protein
VGHSAITLILAVLAVSSSTDEGHPHYDEQHLGTVHFPISCAPSVQKAFERDVALLHSFAFETAEATFRRLPGKILHV